MRVFPAVLTALILMSAMGGWSGALAAQPELSVAPPNAVAFPDVILHLLPRDGRGVFISGLRDPTEFSVTEDGRPVGPIGLESDSGHADICLVLDLSRSMLADGKIEEARRSARWFLRQLRPEDQCALVTFDAVSRLAAPLSRDRSPHDTVLRQAMALGDSTAFYDGVYSALSVLEPPSGGNLLSAGGARADARRVIIALTDGKDVSSTVGPDDVIALARKSGVSVCIVALGLDADVDQLRGIARSTGGLCLEAPTPQSLQGLYAAIAAQIREEYRLTYRSPRPEMDGTRRVVDVRLPRFQVSGNAVYQAPGRGTLLSSGTAAASDRGWLAVAVIVILAASILTAGWVILTAAGRRSGAPLVPLWVSPQPTRIGRGAECEVVLDSQQVSRIHARIEIRGDGFWLTDEGSRNGTFVNRRRIRQAQRISPGDRLKFGDREFEFAGLLPG